ncbi:MAG: type I restriction enzyme, S subunit [Rhodobacteraceae bacterium HLUCCA12]|nr:MAG: type I restriction enzyme, S subunit [Rhodobacteraceae bacterium HLUCCA12]
MSWQMAPLGEVLAPIQTWNPRRAAASDVFDYIDLSSVDRDEKAIMAPTPTIPSEAPSRARQLVKSGDILVSTVRPNLNAVAVVEEELDGATASTGFSVLRPDEKKAASRYIYHWVRTPSFVADMVRKATGASYPAVSDKIVAESLIPLPPLEEQRRIAGILDAADALRRCRREALALLDTLPGAIFAEMFGDRLYGPDRATDTVPLAEVAHIQSGITKGRRLKSGEKTEETAYLAVANVQDKRLDLSNVKMIEATEKERERYALAVGDLLLTEGGDPDKLGRGTVWNDEIPGAIHQNHIFRVRVTDETVQPIFLSHLLSSPYGRGYFLRMAKQTTGIASINKTQLSGFPAILPDEGEQIEFVQRLKSYQDQKERYISHLGEVDCLFASLQSRAFAGEL